MFERKRMMNSNLKAIHFRTTSQHPQHYLNMAHSKYVRCLSALF
uniref:Uncharacterized protein n=1 Tax=Anguilla anguilla TaxID=7936 RepID=A0A0E9TS47_ANGAN